MFPTMTPRIGGLSDEGRRTAFGGVASIDDLDLPESLERIEGTIRFRNHRISLYLILDAYLRGKSIPQIRSLFPTLASDKLWDALLFVNSHINLMRAYHADMREIENSIIEDHGRQGPSIEELRRMWKEKYGREYGDMIHAIKIPD